MVQCTLPASNEKLPMRGNRPPAAVSSPAWVWAFITGVRNLNASAGLKLMAKAGPFSAG